MISGRDDLLMQLLHCGSLDLALLDDVGYDFCDILDEYDRENFSVVGGFNGLMSLVFDYGFRQLEQAINDRKCELEAIQLNERELEDYEQEELDALNDLDPWDDMETFHNFIDTHVWCRRHYETYKTYLEDALDAFREGTGFEIGGEM